jgi:ornithine cyclodeaminase/alanine dehydrogenase-like protein (mu-crystallin family)
VDRRESISHGLGDILQPIASVAISETDVLGDLHDLASGSAQGRAALHRPTSPSSRTRAAAISTS